MKTFRVLSVHREYKVAFIEAETAESAENLADDNYDSYDWDEVGELEAEICFGDTEEEM